MKNEIINSRLILKRDYPKKSTEDETSYFLKLIYSFIFHINLTNDEILRKKDMSVLTFI